MSKRPRILMLTTQLGYGGAETSFIRLANFLAQSMEVTVALFTADYGHGARYAQGHEPLHAPIVLLDAASPQPRLLRWARRIGRMRALKRQHDVTISFLPGSNLVNVLAGHNRHSVISLRGSRKFDPVSAPWQRRLFQYMLDPMMYALAARIVPVSHGLTHEIRASGLPKVIDKVRVISPFIERATIAARLKEPPPEVFAALRGQPVIVAAGRLSVEKGFHHLIRVVAAVAKAQAGVKLLLIGDGPMLGALRGQCASLGLAVDNHEAGVSAVIFAGYQQDVLPLMKLGCIYAMSSATEGFPNVLLEAMAVGLPVIAADTPWGVRSILCATPSETAEPYPTQTATVAEFGTLMPRIDRPEYESIWCEALGAALATPPAISTATAQRPYDFDLAVVGEKWKTLLAECEG
jgi:glycosyltransferase involved in cell wall biosynthesis